MSKLYVFWSNFACEKSNFLLVKVFGNILKSKRPRQLGLGHKYES